MEKWKIAVIALLLGGMAGYGFYQQPRAATAPEGDNTLEPEITETPVPAEPLPKWLAPRMGKTPPAWNIPANLWLNTPRPITTADLKGKVTILEFWRTGCSHCEEAIPHLENTYKMMKPRGLQIVAIHTPGDISDPENPETKWSEVQRFVRERKVTYPVAFDTNGEIFKKVYKGQRYPTILVTDRQGIVRYAHTGFTEDKSRRLTLTLMELLR